MMLIFLMFMGALCLAGIGVLAVLLRFAFEAFDGWSAVGSFAAMFICACGCFASVFWAVEIIVERALK